ncbi:2-hydroxychromene-2-carboxylate isomerase/DsbA-like thioredoxin domain [Qipengyuania citrea LAMA 915]|jgi:predicted DsbA family dithiol-disulfide isomerase|uniref:2-hydroxychromene-2-carboxylate isomerase/DsbA-like thioredoxin domain n=1 Tax=Qipengyuania citrea LAMA 915 TaxID=1306953 RepID=A0A0L1KEA9_9SPHN|nr:DsbA family oxidoreductase [Qipengyuania citrea]KNH02390.1 2-hydroxychromene-2-carboxylate isomerase/DsbA-like thioredoxin domain [Qipengyuania citrea LAMA 915]MBN92321.1 DsbA family oxidoreductase [Erythrobacteraceae bacterium]
MSETRTLRIDIWSDVMCPWCLVGWGSLQKGLAQLEGEIEADIRWHAFELNPDMAPEGEERTAHIARKYGTTTEQSKAVQGRMREAAENAGVSLDYEGGDPEPTGMMWNTFAAHKLLTWAGEEHGPQRQTALKLALFRAHFNHRRALGDDAVLLDIAEEEGFDRTAARGALASEELAHKVRAEERAAWDLNITGVPAMVVENKFMIPGAQPAEAYADALRRVAEKTAA